MLERRVVLGCGWTAAAAGARRLLVVALAVVLLAGPLPVQAQQAPPLQGFADLVERVGPAVVNIATSKTGGGEGQPMPMPQFPPGSPFDEMFRDFFNRQQQQQRQRRQTAMGSGFLISADGYVVTNNHVVAEADEITVFMADESEYPAKLVGADQKTDLAVLKIERPTPFPFVEFVDDSDKIRVGDWMLAIGNPFGLGNTVTAGIVSARGRDIQAGPYDDFIQVDAAINRGNSGGPSFTLEGKVFGINTAIFSPSGGNVGIGFAIPSNLARPVIESLKTTGKVARGWLGVRIQQVSPDIAESLGLPQDRGALIAAVTPGGPAAAAQLQAGDVILEFDGKQITKMRSLPRIVAETGIGKTVDVKVWRRGVETTFQVTVGTLPEDEQLAELGSTAPSTQPPAEDGIVSVPALGAKLAAIDDALRQRFQLPAEAKGVVVVEAEPLEGEDGLAPGDIITEVGQEPVATPGEVTIRVEDAKQKGRRSVLLLVERAGDSRFTSVRLRG
jgi:serine protease Do